MDASWQATLKDYYGKRLTTEEGERWQLRLQEKIRNYSNDLTSVAIEWGKRNYKRKSEFGQLTVDELVDMVFCYLRRNKGINEPRTDEKHKLRMICLRIREHIKKGEMDKAWDCICIPENPAVCVKLHRWAESEGAIFSGVEAEFRKRREEIFDQVSAAGITDVSDDLDPDEPTHVDGADWI